MTRWRYILTSLRHYGRLQLVVAAGVATATAVITGALLVGDSMRGSLRERALAGLGRVDVALLAERPFHDAMPGEAISHLGDAPSPDAPAYADAVPLLVLPGTLVAGAGREARRATGLTVYGVPPKFWSLAGKDEEPSGLEEGLAVGREIAAELDLAAGDAVLLLLPKFNALPADSALGEKDDTSVSRRFKATVVAADKAPMVRFSLRPTQQTPRNVFVPLDDLQRLLDLPGRANAAVFATGALLSTAEDALPETARASLKAALTPTLDDFGLRVELITGGENASGGYLRISGRQLVLPPAVVDAARESFGDRGAQFAVTYLANTIRVGDRQIPYSTVAGVDSTAELGPLLTPAGEPIELADDQIALNAWAAQALQAEVGDAVTVAYYRPETTHGRLQEAEPITLELRAIVSLADDQGLPTAAADPAFAPELPGVTDQESIDRWELPFDLVEEVTQDDEDYWDERRTTPKAFVSHALAARLWGSRWGEDSVVRIPADGLTAQDVAAELRDELEPEQLGMSLLPVRQLAIDAASGTTPFDGLFLGFSLFLVASAIMLIVLLFRLGAEQRASESGLLLAAGFSPQSLRRLALAEGGLVAAVGAAAGAALGIAYAGIMVYGLKNWWSAAANAPFLTLHIEPRSVFIGLASGVLVALAAMAWSLRKLVKLPPRQLLAGDAQPRAERLPDESGRRPWIVAATAVGAVALAVAARWLEGEAQAGAFFGGGALALIAALGFVRRWMRRPSRTLNRLTLDGLTLRNARRNPGRTQLSLGLAAVASFLIVALSAFRLAPTAGGTGGFTLVATSDLPLQFDLGAAEGRTELGFSRSEQETMANLRVESCLVHDGEDASCLNLYQTTQPRVLGVPPSLAVDDRFAWGGAADVKAGKSPWTLLDADLGVDDAGRPVVPMVLDRNTAMYSLKLYRVGDRLALRDEFDQPRTFQVVGMLANSVLQGDVLVGEAAFRELYPSTSGRRFFLVGPRNGESADGEDDNALEPEQLSALLESQLEDYGFDAVNAHERLAALLAVQNTYLSTFQTLGALGLLLGVVGLAVVQVRSVLERRGELALMRAAGFRKQRLARMVLTENFVLLGGGLLIGCAAALAAVLPHAWSQGASVPWTTLAMLVASVAAAGVVAGWFAARRALRVPLLPALRGE